MNGWSQRLREQVARVASRRKTNFQCLQRLEEEGHNERRIAIGRKNYLFAGSDAGGRSAAALYSLIESAKLNGLNPQHYLADVLARIADHPARRIAELLPWNWQPLEATRAAA